MIGERIRKLRLEKNLTQAQLGSILSVTQQAVGKWEKNIAEPDSSALNKMAEIFNCSLDYLLGRSDSPTPSKGMSPEKKEAFFKGLDDLQLDKYKNLTPEDKELLAAQFNALIDRLEKGKKE